MQRAAAPPPTGSARLLTDWQRVRIRQALRLRNAGVVYALILLLAAFAVAAAVTGRVPYLQERNLVNIASQSSILGIIVVPMTILLISGNFDLSVGSVAAFSATVALLVVDERGVLVAVVLALAAGLLAGTVNGLLVQKVGINSFIVTLGTLTAIRGMVLVITDARQVLARTPEGRDGLGAIYSGRWPTPDLLLVVGVVAAAIGALRLWRSRRGAREGWASTLQRSWAATALLLVGAAALVASAVVDASWDLPKPVWYFGALAIVGWAVCRFTIVGRRLYAVGGNTEAARLAGINVDRYKIVPFVLNGLAAGFAGLLFAGRIGGADAQIFSMAELTVIAAVILGGTSLFGGVGSVLKSVAGVLILFTLANGFNMLDVGVVWQQVVEGSVIIAAAATYTVAGRYR